MSAPKRRQLLLAIIIVLVVGLGAGAAYKLWSVRGTTRVSASCDLQVGDECLSLVVADTEQSRAQGLSGRRNLPSDQAMLFVFDEPGHHCFWMKDMNFPIDMVWLNKDKEIVTVASDVAPNTYPKTFCPDEQAKYVLEFSAGTANELGLREGQQLQLQTK